MRRVSANPAVDYDMAETMEKFWEGFVAWGISGGVNVTDPPQPTNPPDVVVSGSDPWYDPNISSRLPSNNASPGLNTSGTHSGNKTTLSTGLAQWLPTTITLTVPLRL